MKITFETLYLLNRNSFYYSLIFIFLTVTYIYTISPHFGFYVYDFAFFKFFIAFILNFLVSLFLPIKFIKPSGFLLHLLYMFTIMPILVLYAGINYSGVIVFTALLAFFIIFLTKFLKIKPIFFQNISLYLLINTFLSIALITLIVKMITTGGNFNFNLLTLYDFRLEADSENQSLFLNYFSSFVSAFFIPAAIAISVHKRSPSFVLLSLAFAVIAFGLLNHKAAVFYPFFAVAIYFFLSTKDPFRVFLISLLFLVIFSLLIFPYDELYSTTEGLYRIGLTAYGVRRVLFEPALINYFYYDFFSENNFITWANSRITFGLVDYPYSLNPAPLIGLNYYGSEFSSPNSGFLGSGFMHGGILGVAIYAFVIGLILAFLDSCEVFLESRLIVSLTICPLFITFLSSDLVATMLSHGLMLAILAMPFISTKKVRKTIRD